MVAVADRGIMGQFGHYNYDKNNNARRETQSANIHLGDPNCPNNYLYIYKLTVLLLNLTG